MNRWKFVDRTFVWFGNRSLDWLEKLPKFQNGAIAQRQHSRERQRAEAEAAHIHTKLPEGVKLDFLFFRLTETFPIEDAEKLRQGIKRLLPFLETEFWRLLTRLYPASKATTPRRLVEPWLVSAKHRPSFI